MRAMRTGSGSPLRRGAANKGLLVVLGVLILAAGGFWIWQLSDKRKDPNEIPPSATRMVALYDPATGKTVVEVSEVELQTWEKSGELYKHPKTGEFSLSVRKAESKSQLSYPG